MLKDVFSFAEHQDKATNELVYELTLTRKIDESVSKEDSAINNAKFIINVIEVYVAHYTPSTPQQAIFLK